ncbi:hypothetical protein BJ508DRAFT_326602 [Ascobolus immersus RN42]|uniref:F-box domain-containing protein n=1 Tax=Ascobolus immersus RN42 TaxID=1160509 RepID=A0A3N4I6W8_ASCIM|nr:hypothetical protein BJ508DRAFT_326602 [Ascobolus immersus RN42]
MSSTVPTTRKPYGLDDDMQPLHWYSRKNYWRRNPSNGEFTVRERLITYNDPEDGFVIQREEEGLVPRPVLTKIREPFQDESWQDYFESQGYFYLRAFSDFYLLYTQSKVIKRDLDKHSRLEHLTRKEVRHAICQDLGLKSVDEYIDLFFLDDFSRDKDFNRMYFPLGFLYGCVLLYPIAARNQLLWDRMFKSILFSSLIDSSAWSWSQWIFVLDARPKIEASPVSRIADVGGNVDLWRQIEEMEKRYNSLIASISTQVANQRTLLNLPVEIRLEIYTQSSTFSLLHLSHTCNHLYNEINAYPSILSNCLGFASNDRITRNLRSFAKAKIRFEEGGKLNIDLVSRLQDNDEEQLFRKLFQDPTVQEDEVSWQICGLCLGVFWSRRVRSKDPYFVCLGCLMERIASRVRALEEDKVQGV